MKQHLNTLYITKDDTWLSLDGETVTVSLHQEKLLRIPLINLEAIQTFGWNIGASPQLMGRCAAKGIHIAFCNPNGKLMCNVTGVTSGNVLLRRQQYRIADNVARSVAIAREMVAAKILNARTVLQRAARDYPNLVAQLRHPVRELVLSVKAARMADNPQSLLGIEGNAADVYFSAFHALLTTSHFAFDHRNRRPPKDPVNALLSFIYAILASDCKSALEAVGLDSFVGFYHRDRPGRAGLALDLMEEFRAPLADRVALSLLNRGQLSLSDFISDEEGSCRLSDDARKLVLKTWQMKKSDQIMHPYVQEKMSIGMLLHIQARLLAQHVRGSLDAYPPMLWH